MVVGPNALHTIPATTSAATTASAIHASRRLVMMASVLRLPSSVLLKSETAHDRSAAVFFPHPVDRALGERLAPAGLIEEVARIGLVGLADVGDADADQAEARAVGLAREQLAPGGKYFLRELGRVGKPARTRADLELVALELERHRAAGKPAGFETRGDFFR